MLRTGHRLPLLGLLKTDMSVSKLGIGIFKKAGKMPFEAGLGSLLRCFPRRKVERFFFIPYLDYRDALMVLKMFWIIGPMRVSAAITTTATSTRIKAYSTIPWPRSLRENNIGIFLLSVRMCFQCPRRRSGLTRRRGVNLCQKPLG
jgi:hypothetical protein